MCQHKIKNCTRSSQQVTASSIWTGRRWQEAFIQAYICHGLGVAPIHHGTGYGCACTFIHLNLCCLLLVRVSVLSVPSAGQSHSSCPSFCCGGLAEEA
eukprot:1159539-Pelagomonas_calceolata.AAC.3